MNTNRPKLYWGILFLLLTACADSRGKKAYIDSLENDRYQKSIAQSYQAGNLVQLTDQNGTLRQVALKDVNGDGVADGIDLNSDGNMEIRLMAGSETRISPWAFIAPVDIDNNGSSDYFLYFNIANNAVQIKFLTANNINALPLAFIINVSNQITGLDTNADALSDDARLNGTVVVSAGSAPDSTPPSQPASPGGAAGGSTQIDLTWTAASDDSSAAANISYEICQALSAGGCSTFSATYNVPAGQTNYSATGLTALTTYYYTVRSRDASGNYGTPSGEFPATTAALGTVNNPTYSPVVGIFGAAQNVTITTTTPGASICYSVDGVTTPACDAAALCTAGATYFSAINVATTTNLQAIACKLGNTASAVVGGAFTIDTTPPSVPGSFAANPASTTQIDLSWAASTDTVTAQPNLIYEICQSTTPGACGTFTASITTGAGAVAISAMSLSPLTTYYFVIRAKDSVSNNSTASGEISATTNATGTVADPTYTPVAGTYALAQNVDLSTVTPGATICYTTDGVTTPACDAAAACTTGSTYALAINTAATTTYRAIGCKVGYTTSGVAVGTIAIGVDTWDDTTRPRVLASSAAVKPNINTSWGPLASAVKYKLYNWTGVWNYHSETTNTNYTYTDTTQWMRVCGQNSGLVDFHCSVYAPPPNHAAANVTWLTQWADYFSDSSVSANYYVRNPAQHSESNGYMQLNQNVTDDGSTVQTYYQDAGKRYTRIHFKKYFHRNGNNFMGDFAISDYANSGKSLYVSMYYTDWESKYGLNFREAIYDSQNLTPSSYNWTTLDATQRFDQWLDFEIIIDRVGKAVRVCQNGVYYNQAFTNNYSGDFILQHTPYGWNTGHFVRIDDYEIESSDTDFPVYPTPGNSLISNVSYFGEQPYAPIQNTIQNASHGPNLQIDSTGKLHFAYSDNGAVKYISSADKGTSWTNNNPNSLRTDKASNISLAVENSGNILVTGKYDIFDFDGNQGTDNPGNYSRETFEAYYNGTAWNHQGIKRAWNWFSPTYGYVKTMDIIRDRAAPMAILPDNSISVSFTEGGWFFTGYNLCEIRRTSGTWNTAYATQNFLSDGVLISNNSGVTDSNLNTPYGYFTKSDGTQYAFYNRHYISSGNFPCETYYRSRPPAGSWGAATLIASNAYGTAAALDQAGDIHVLYNSCNTSNGNPDNILHYKKNFGGAEIVSTETAGEFLSQSDLYISPSGKVTAAWSLSYTSVNANYREIRYNERTPEGVWGTATNLTTGYSGYGKNFPYFIRGSRYDVFPRRRQLVYNENYNDGTDKKRIMLYTWPDF